MGNMSSCIGLRCVICSSNPFIDRMAHIITKFTTSQVIGMWRCSLKRADIDRLLHLHHLQDNRDVPVRRKIMYWTDHVL